MRHACALRLAWAVWLAGRSHHRRTFVQVAAAEPTAEAVGSAQNAADIMQQYDKAAAEAVSLTSTGNMEVSVVGTEDEEGFDVFVKQVSKTQLLPVLAPRTPHLLLSMRGCVKYADAAPHLARLQGASTWQMRKTYDEFAALDKALSETAKAMGVKLPKLKKLKKPAERRKLLGSYLVRRKQSGAPACGLLSARTTH